MKRQRPVPDRKHTLTPIDALAGIWTLGHKPMTSVKLDERQISAHAFPGRSVRFRPGPPQAGRRCRWRLRMAGFSGERTQPGKYSEPQSSGRIEIIRRPCPRSLRFATSTFPRPDDRADTAARRNGCRACLEKIGKAFGDGFSGPGFLTEVRLSRLCCLDQRLVS